MEKRKKKKKRITEGNDSGPRIDGVMLRELEEALET